MAERDITQLVNRLVDHTLARHGVPEQARQGQSTQLFRSVLASYAGFLKHNLQDNINYNLPLRSVMFSPSFHCPGRSYAIRLLGSNVPRASSTVPDEQAVLQAIRQDLEMRGSPNAARSGLHGLHPHASSCVDRAAIFQHGCPAHTQAAGVPQQAGEQQHAEEECPMGVADAPAPGLA